jgi:hypothetical protein
MASTLRHRLFVPPGGDAALPDPVRPAGLGDPTPLDWLPGEAAGRWTARIALGGLGAGRLLVPTLLPGAVPLRGWTMTALFGEAGLIPLAPIPAIDPLEALPPWPKAAVGPVEDEGECLVGGLDCVESATDIAALALEIDVVTDGPAPDAALLVADRALHVEPADSGGTAPALHLPAHSQKTRDAHIADHVCSPVGVAMALGGQGTAVDVEAFARRCEHPHHGRLFGLWPLNLARARAEGADGLVRLFEDASEAAALLRAGFPIVASIRFEAGGLEGAPLPRTGGHLVVLRGLEDDVAVVNDPAAPDDASVARRYDRGQFLRAWLADRGVGYVLWPRVAEDR